MWLTYNLYLIITLSVIKIITKGFIIKFIDLFAGIGGFRISLELFHEECVFSSEWDKYAQDTYLYNFGEIPQGDITKINEKSIPNHDILCGGFPCQAFSVSGKQAGFNDARGTLFFDIARIAKEKKPKIIFLENVKNLLKHDNGKTIKTVKEILASIGYGDSYVEILDSSHYGVPQHRERVFIICFRDDLNVKDFTFPKPCLTEISLNDILESDELTNQYIINRKDIVFNNDSNLSKKDLFGESKLKPVRVGTISKGGQGERIYSSHGHAITLSAYGGGVAGKTGAYLINAKVRQLSPRECLRVQGFPETFNFPKNITKSQIYKMCGNSVSVPVIKAIYKQILRYI